MIFGEDFVYLELAKTGTSYTRSVLNKLFPDQLEFVGRHNTFRELEQQYQSRFESSLKFGNVRNPWDWYVSLWAYGCMKKGGLYNYTTLSKKYLQQNQKAKFIGRYKLLFSNGYLRWRQVYSDSSNKANFRKWLEMVLVSESDQLPHHNLYNASLIGRYTFRYLNMYTKELDKLLEIKSFDQIKAYDTENNFMDYIFQLENINEGLSQFGNVLSVPKETSSHILSSNTAVNRSHRDNYRSYYDDKSLSLVESKDRLIIEKYGYTF